jgi:hypothetical protein
VKLCSLLPSCVISLVHGEVSHGEWHRSRHLRTSNGCSSSTIDEILAWSSGNAKWGRQDRINSESKLAR